LFQTWCRAVEILVSSSFFEQMTFEQMTHLPRSRNNWEILKSWKVSISLNLDREVLEYILLSRWNREILILTKISRSSRLRFWKSQDFFDYRDRDSQSRSCRDKSRPPGLLNCLSHLTYLNCLTHLTYLNCLHYHQILILFLFLLKKLKNL
jgi:hypothetical protein